MLDAGREGGGRLAEVVVEPRELGEAGEVKVYVGAEALRAGAGVAGEAPRGRLHLEEEVALPQEPLGPRSSVSSKRTPRSLRRLSCWATSMSGRSFVAALPESSISAPKVKKNAAVGTGTRSR